MQTGDSSDPFDYRHHAGHHAAQSQMAPLEAYYRWALDAFGTPPAPPVVDAGAGAGHLAAILLANGTTPITLLEGGIDNVATLNARFGGNSEVTVIECDLAETARVLDGRPVRSIVTMDVLEHLPDDAGVLAEFHKSLLAGGRIFVKVPAHGWLYGAVDRASGHYRRYARRDLTRRLQQAGFEVESCRYMNMVGVGPYLVKSRILRRDTSFSGTFTDKQLKRINRSIPKLRKLDSFFGPPVGLSVVAVGRKV